MENLIKALAKAQGLFPPIPKNKTIEVAKGVFRPYADLADVMHTITPTLSKNGLAITQQIEAGESGEVLVTTLWHESGEHIRSYYILPNAVTTKPHLMASSITYARRYSVCALLGIVADDDDDGKAANDSHAEKPKPAKKPAPKKAVPNKAMERPLSPEEKQRFFAKVNNVHELTMDELEIITRGFFGIADHNKLNIMQAGEIIKKLETMDKQDLVQEALLRIDENA